MPVTGGQVGGDLGSGHRPWPSLPTRPGGVTHTRLSTESFSLMECRHFFHEQKSGLKSCLHLGKRSVPPESQEAQELTHLDLHIQSRKCDAPFLAPDTPVPGGSSSHPCGTERQRTSWGPRGPGGWLPISPFPPVKWG